MSRATALRDTELSADDLDDNLEPIGRFKNGRDPRFAPTRVYLWKDVFQLLLDLELNVPDEW